MLAGGAIVAGLKDAGAAVVELAHDADRLSVSTEQLSRLRFAARQTGIDAETLNKAMLKSQETIGKAATEGGEAAEKLQAMGLNIKELVNQNPADQFKAIAEKIASIHNPAERAAAEVAIFGKAGAELKPLLEQGAAGLDKLSSEADKLGITIKSVDAENALRAGQAIQKIQDAATGLQEQIAARLAPVIEDVANRIVAWAEEGNRMGKIVNAAMETVAYGAAFVATAFRIAKAEVELLGSGGAWAIYGLIEAFDGLAKAGAYVSEHVFGHHIDTSGIDAAADHMKNKAKELFASANADAADAMSGNQAERIFEYFDQVQAKANQTSQEALKAHEAIGNALDVPENENLKKIAETIAELHKQVDTFGMSEGAKKLYDLKLLGADDKAQAEAKALVDQLDTMKKQADIAKELDKLRKDAHQAGMDEGAKLVDNLKSMGANDDQIAEAKRLQQQIEATNAAKEKAKQLDEEAKKVREDALTPMQKEREELDKLKELYQSGRISIQEYASAAAKKEAELHGEAHDTQKAATRGTQSAFELMNEINRRIHGKGDKKEQLAQQQLNAQQQANKYLANLDQRLNRQPTPQMAIPIA